MLGVEVGGVGGDFQGKRAGRIGIGRAGDWAAVELAPASGDVDQLGGAETVQTSLRGGVKFSVNQPERLREKDQKQSSGEKLGTSEAFAGEEFGHKAEPSVLP